MKEHGQARYESAWLVSYHGIMSAIGDRIIDRMQATIDHGATLLNRITYRALERHGLNSTITRIKLYTAAELVEIGRSLAATIGAGELLGRARLLMAYRKARLKQARAYAEADNKLPDYLPDDIKAILTPKSAMEFFLELVPELGIDVKRWGENLERHAFTVAAATEDEVLSRIRDIVIGGMGRGEPYGPQEIRKVLDRAGMLPSNPQYSEMVYRTNVMDAHAVGHDREMMESPIMRETFPAWLYSAAVDEHSRKWHAARNDRMYSSNLPFSLVRGTKARDVCNCRCVPIDLDRWEVDDRLASGEIIYTSIG